MDGEVILAFIGGATSTCLVLLLANTIFKDTGPSAEQKCMAKWAESGIVSKYDAIGGCKLRTNDGKFVPDTTTFIMVK